MTQGQWNTRMAEIMATYDVWQRFKCDESSGLPQDTGTDYGFCHMTAGTITTSQVAGPFSGALGFRQDPASTSDVVRSPVYSGGSPNPTTDSNFGFPKAIEGWVKLNETPGSNDTTLLGCGTVAIRVGTNRKLHVWSFWNAGSGTPESTTALTVGEWYYLLANCKSGDCDLWIGRADGSVALEATDTDVLWPVPNSNFLRCGAAGYFNEGAVFVDASYSNLALINAQDVDADLPLPMELASMNAVLPAG